ncbi:MAG: monovalent cation/H(+) antiporter subunit G [Synechococcus sp.]|nr:monovalent cation/H(+) antiporter subunit G [Synechococcus sp.]
MNITFVKTLLEPVSCLLLLAGLVLWFAGTWPLLGRRSFLHKLHYLGIADTLGSALMLLALLLRLNREWPLLLLALLSLVVWNTIFGYVLASCSQALPRREGEP